MKHSEHPLNIYPAELYCDDDNSKVTYALCVKVRNTPEAWGALTSEEFDEACATWWSNAESLAKRLGLGVVQSGRSGGWCVFTDLNGEALDAHHYGELHAEGGKCRETALDVAERVGYAAEWIKVSLLHGLDALELLAA